MGMKRWLRAVCLTGAAVLLCACGNGGRGDGAAGRKETFVPALDTEAEITLYVIGGWENFEALEEVAKDFNEYYPNVSINYTLPDDYASVLANRMITGEELDFFLINNSDGSDLTPFTADAVNLEEAGIDFSNMPQGVRRGGYVNGEMKLFPIMQSVCGYMVNVSLLEEQGLSIPTNNEEFMTVCEAFKAKGIAPVMGYPGSIYQPSANSLLMDIALAENSQEIIDSLNAGEDSYGIIRRNLEDAVALKEKGYISEEGKELEDNYNAVIMRFLEGDVPFMACYAENFSGVKKREALSEAFMAAPFEYQFISSPTGETGFETCYLEEIAFCAYAKSPNVDYTIEFLKFLAIKEELDAIGNVKGMPAVTESSGDPRFAVLEGISDEEKVYFSDIGLDYRVLNFYRQACKALGDGTMDLDGVMESLEVWVR